MNSAPALLVRTTRARQRDATRRQLVQAGLRIVAERGFAGATTAAIAQASGKAHGTVFVHFGTREGLVAELVTEIGRAMSQRLAEISDDAPGLPQVLDSHLGALAQHEVLYARLLCEAATLPDAARARLFALQSGIAWRLRTAYEREAALGAARVLDPVALANMWIALTNHYLMNRDLFSPGASVIAARGAELKAQWLAMIRP
jgi:AcrR family transcriptional regulator